MENVNIFFEGNIGEKSLWPGVKQKFLENTAKSQFFKQKYTEIHQI